MVYLGHPVLYTLQKQFHSTFHGHLVMLRPVGIRGLGVQTKERKVTGFGLMAVNGLTQTGRLDNLTTRLVKIVL